MSRAPRRLHSFAVVAQTRYNRGTLAQSAQPGAPFEPRFRTALLRWFDRHRRDLPWRHTRDPYRIWAAEIMLQQTRVAAVLERYGEFLRRFPDVRALAAARPSDVLAAWSGLGYYRRARALHQAAKLVVKVHNGRLPNTAAELRELPGIGRYTAAAIASIAYGERCAVLDGNVERVLGRVLALNNGSASVLWEAAEQMLSRVRPGDFNQAMMELGATVCLPQQPRCAECPVRALCATRGAGNSRPQSSRQQKEIAYGLARRGESVYLVRRSHSASLMPDMWELPQIPQDAASPAVFTLRHAITVTDYRVHVHEIPARAASGGRWVGREQTPALPLTGLARKILRRAGII